jgi:hypothetical protein
MRAHHTKELQHAPKAAAEDQVGKGNSAEGAPGPQTGPKSKPKAKAEAKPKGKAEAKAKGQAKGKSKAKAFRVTDHTHSQLTRELMRDRCTQSTCPSVRHARRH